MQNHSKPTRTPLPTDLPPLKEPDLHARYYSSRTGALGSVTVPLGLCTHRALEPAIQAFEPGARMLLVTRGILEAQRGREQFGVERATAVLQNIPNGSASDLCNVTLEDANEFRKPPWYSPERLPFAKPQPAEDPTPLHPMPSPHHHPGHIDTYLFDQPLRSNTTPAMRALHAGCGSGPNLVSLPRKGYEVFASDHNPPAIEHTRTLAATLAPHLPATN